MHRVDFAHEDVDLAIRHGDSGTSGLHVTRLCAEELIPVCSPKLTSGRHAVRSPSDLARHTLLHVNDRSDWSRWLEAVGEKTITAARGPSSIKPAWHSMRL